MLNEIFNQQEIRGKRCLEQLLDMLESGQAQIVIEDESEQPKFQGQHLIDIVNDVREYLAYLRSLANRKIIRRHRSRRGSRYVDEMRARHRRYYYKWTTRDEATLIGMLHDGYAMLEIARELGRTICSVRQRLSMMRRSRMV